MTTTTITGASTAFHADPRVWALMLAATLTIMSNATISPALPELAAAFPDNENAALIVRLLVTAPSLLVAIIAPLAGMLIDRVGRRGLLLGGIGLYALSGAAGAVLPSLEAILASRMILGIAVAAVMTAQSTLIGDYFSGRDRDRFMGWQMAATNIGGLIFIVFAGYLAGLSARLPFLIYAIALIYLPFLYWALPETTRENQVRALRDGAAPSLEQPGWQRMVATLLALAVSTFAIFYVVPTEIPFYLASLGHAEPSTTSLVLAMQTVFGGISALFFARVRIWLPGGLAPAAGYLVGASGLAVLASVPSLGGAMTGAMLIGLGFGQVMPTFVAQALNAAPPHFRGRVSGLMTSAIFLGQFVSPLITRPMLNALGYSGTFGAIAVILIAAAISVALVLRPIALGSR